MGTALQVLTGAWGELLLLWLHRQPYTYKGHSHSWPLDTGPTTGHPALVPCCSPQGQDAVLAEAVPTACLVGVVKHRVAEGTFVALFQLLHKPVLCVGLKVQGNGVAGVLADETTGDPSLFL